MKNEKGKVVFAYNPPTRRKGFLLLITMSASMFLGVSYTLISTMDYTTMDQIIFSIIVLIVIIVLSFQYLKQSFNVYENGITIPINWLNQILYDEGVFIHLDEIKEYRIYRGKRINCVIVLNNEYTVHYLQRKTNNKAIKSLCMLLINNVPKKQKK